MDVRTLQVYEKSARAWIAAREPKGIPSGRLISFMAGIPEHGTVADLGCGPGWYAAEIQRMGHRVVALDAAAAMLGELRQRSPSLPAIRADLAALPFGRLSLDGAWAPACYPHLSRAELSLSLAQLHATLKCGAPLELWLANLPRDASPEEVALGEAERRFTDGDFPGRHFTLIAPERGVALLEGAGFEGIEWEKRGGGFWVAFRARRAHTLPDFVRPGLELLICGLNPSPYSVEQGVPFARPGNRFWPAAAGAGLGLRDRDPYDATRRGVGFTDLSKTCTARASELEPGAYARGVVRLEELVHRNRPRVVCFVGLEGWRRAVDRRAVAGWIPGGFAGSRAYLMPSTSGLNAHSRLEDLIQHLRRAASGGG